MRPRFKIQYPMKNRDETNSQKLNLQVALQKYFKMWKSLTFGGFHLVAGTVKTPLHTYFKAGAFI